MWTQPYCWVCYLERGVTACVVQWPGQQCWLEWKLLAGSNNLHARLAEGEKSDENQAPDPPGWGSWHGVRSPHLKNKNFATETSNQETLQPEARDYASQSTSDEMTDVDQTGPGVHTPNVDSLTPKTTSEEGGDCRWLKPHVPHRHEEDQVSK
jgi:hypothetical protein